MLGVDRAALRTKNRQLKLAAILSCQFFQFCLPVLQSVGRFPAKAEQARSAAGELKMLPIDRLVPVLEAFAAAGFRSTAGYAAIADGRLVATRNGRRTFIRSSDLQKFIDSLPRSASNPAGPPASRAA
jgi:hypothetical protein